MKADRARRTAIPSVRGEAASVPVALLARGERRMEGATYLSIGYLVRRHIADSGMPFVRLSELARVWQPPRLKGIRVSREHGAPYLAATQAFDLRPRPRKWLAPAKTEGIQDLYLKGTETLVTRSGTVGEVIHAYSAHAGTVMSDDLLRVEAHDPSKSGYIYAFLRTAVGRQMMRASHYGNVIKHLEASHLEELPVPTADDDTYLGVNEQIHRVFELRDKAIRLEQEADDLFADAMGKGDSADQPEENDWQAPSRRLARRRRRLDAYHHNPSAATLEDMLARKALRMVALRECVDEISLPARFRRDYADQGVPYIDSEAVFKVNPRIDKHIAKGTDVPLAEYLVSAGWLLVARSGQIYGLNGSLALATTKHEGKVVSEHLIRIVPSSGRGAPQAGYIKVALGHPVYGRPRLLRWAYGTQIPELDPEDVGMIPIPRLDAGLETEIAWRTEEALECRLLADELEDEAIASVEAHVRQLMKQFRSPVESAP